MKLSVERGSFSYRKDTPVLKDIHFSVDSGQILAILGPNGAGKTTLLRCITGMLRWSDGCSLLDGEPIRTMPERTLWKKMAYVPQAKAASSAYTAFETVLLGRSSHLNVFSAPGREDVQKAMDAMDRLGIAHLAQKKCTAISGGELQMVLIARALCAEPRVLILDEPESNLDFKNQLVVLDAMTELARQGMTCIFNTHYPAHALQRSHKALLLKRGGEAIFGDTACVVTRENIRAAFGVDAVIGQVETGEKSLPNVVPLSVATGTEPETTDRRVIGAVTIIAKDNRQAAQINAILHDYGHLLIGRMGMPYREGGVYIINITLDALESQVVGLNHKLSLLPGVSVKTTIAQGDFQEG